jgi:hypothetical protein
MDYAEKAAQRLFESLIPGARMEYRTSQSNGEYDFDLHWPDRHVSAVEVTSSINQSLEETHDAILHRGKGGNAIPTRLCTSSWFIHPDPDARINLLRESADQYLAAIEGAGINGFRGLRDDHPSVQAIYRDLGVISGSVAAWIKPGNILMALPGNVGPVAVGAVMEAAEREAFKTDNRRKLGAANSAERYLAVYVDPLTLAYVALLDFEPTPVLPNLPPEITDIWAFSESHAHGGYVLWRAGFSLPWTKQRLEMALQPVDVPLLEASRPF